MLTKNDTILSVRNLTIRSGEQVLVQSLDLDIHPGDVLGIAGESGSGKTMMTKAFLRILPPGVTASFDELVLFGQAIGPKDKKQWKKIVGEQIGLIPQNTVQYLHPMLKIRTQITDGFLALKKGTRKEGVEKAKKLLKLVGFEDPERILNSYAWELSGGMRQRVNIAMALMNDPQLLVADEPTTALDAAIQRQIMELFVKIHQEQGIAMILISHDLGMLELYSDRTLVMYAGRMVEEGSSQVIFDAPAHPYTRALMKVVPSLDRNKEERLQEIPGYVPDSGRDMESCIFRPRCPYACDDCLKKTPMIELGEGHRCLCILGKPDFEGNNSSMRGCLPAQAMRD